MKKDIFCALYLIDKELLKIMLSFSSFDIEVEFQKNPHIQDIMISISNIKKLRDEIYTSLAKEKIKENENIE